MVDVAGVPERAVARDLARAVAGGSLVKSGIFGGDPSWGRILAALGARIGARSLPLDLARVTLDIQGVRVYGKGGPIAFDAQGAGGAHEEGRDRRAPGSGRSARNRRARWAAT